MTKIVRLLKSDAIEEQAIVEGKSDRTIKHYLSDLRQFAMWFEQTTGETFAPAALTGIDVVGYRSYLMTVKNYQPATTNRKLASLSSFCRWAKGEGLIEEIPTAEIKGVRQEQPTAPKSLSRRDWLRFLRTVHRGGNKRDIALVELLGNTGLRAGEVTALELPDIEIAPRKGQVTVRRARA